MSPTRMPLDALLGYVSSFPGAAHLAAGQFVPSKNTECFKKECSFFPMEVSPVANLGAKTEHVVGRLPLPEGIGHFTKAASAYAVRVAVIAAGF